MTIFSSPAKALKNTDPNLVDLSIFRHRPPSDAVHLFPALAAAQQSLVTTSPEQFCVADT
jgi:hypothetical protein